MRVIAAAAFYFLIIFGIGFLLGPLRVFWLEPRLGETVPKCAADAAWPRRARCSAAPNLECQQLSDPWRSRSGGEDVAREPLDNTNGPDTYLARDINVLDNVTPCYVLTTRSCLFGERYQSTAAINRSAGTSPTK